MRLTVLGSGSSGNCYIVGNSNERILLDCGMPYRETLKALNFNVAVVDAILVSHEHKDHAMSARAFSKMGVPIYSGAATAHKCEYICPVSALKPFSAKNFDIMGFPLPHDETPNFGFLVRHSDIGKLLYMTDLAYCPYNFRKVGINHLMVECNYIESDLDVNDDAYKHRVQGHASLSTTKGIIRANMTDALKTVTIIHVSANYGDPDRMLTEVKSVVGDGVEVNIAVPGLSIQL